MLDSILFEDDTLSFLEEMEELEEIAELREKEVQMRRSKEYKPRANPFELSDEEFRQTHRLTKESVTELLNIIKEDLKVSRKGAAIQADLKLMVALSYWGSGEIQENAAETHGISQRSMTDLCRKVALAIVKQRQRFLKIPKTLDEQMEVMSKFESISGFKNVIGVVDGTHIKIPRVSADIRKRYINSKNYSSLNVQIVCDGSLKIRNIVASCSGSTPDSVIFNESTIKKRFEAGEFQGRLLGDSSFACTPYLFTPILYPISTNEQTYNISHFRTRNVVERCIRSWKQRFRCLLNGMSCNLENAKLYIVALAILHNFAIERNELDFDDGELYEEIATLNEQSTAQGNEARAAFIREFFQ